MIELDLAFMDEHALRVFLREQVLRRRAFVAGARGLSPPTACVLCCTLFGSSLKLRGEIVFARDEEPGAGVGVQLEALPVEAIAAIESFLLAAAPEPEMLTRELMALKLPLPEMPESAAQPAEEPDPPPDEAPLATPPESEPEARALHVRMRALTAAEQRRVALTGNLAERVMLERMYGPSVWEPLLSGGKLSPPEVATIARKGTLPRPLVELIASNAGWLASGEVQRALLSNPRSSPMVVAKVLRVLPKHDLMRVPMQTAYPASVRQAAKDMLKR